MCDGRLPAGDRAGRPRGGPAPRQQSASASGGGGPERQVRRDWTCRIVSHSGGAPRPRSAWRWFQHSRKGRPAESDQRLLPRWGGAGAWLAWCVEGPTCPLIERVRVATRALAPAAPGSPRGFPAPAGGTPARSSASPHGLERLGRIALLLGEHTLEEIQGHTHVLREQDRVVEVLALGPHVADEPDELPRERLGRRGDPDLRVLHREWERSGEQPLVEHDVD